MAESPLVKRLLWSALLAGTGALATVMASRGSTLLVREEIELAKAEMTVKMTSIARGAAAVAAGAVFGVFMLVLLLEAVAWGIDAILVDGAGSLWIGFAITTGLLAVMAVGAFLFA